MIFRTVLQSHVKKSIQNTLPSIKSLVLLNAFPDAINQLDKVFQIRILFERYISRHELTNNLYRCEKYYKRAVLQSKNQWLIPVSVRYIMDDASNVVFLVYKWIQSWDNFLMVLCIRKQQRYKNQILNIQRSLIWNRISFLCLSYSTYLFLKILMEYFEI